MENPKSQIQNPKQIQNLKSKVQIVALMVLIFAAVTAAQADTVYLKSGKSVQGTIGEETDKYIQIEFQGRTIYYERKYIDRIEKADSSTNEGSRDDLLRQCVGEFLAGDVEKSRALFARGIKQYPGDPNFLGGLNILTDVQSGAITKEYAELLFKGSKALMDKQFSEAVDYLTRAHTQKPDDTDVLYNLAVAYYSQRDFKSAIDTIGVLLTARPNDAEAYALLGNVCVDAGDIEKAKESLTKAGELFTKDNDSEDAASVKELLDKISATP